MIQRKYRHEYKYICDASQTAILKTRILGLMKADVHAAPNGAYRIRSLYFDDFNDTCYFDNENGVGERSKYRIRIYNNDCRHIMLEKKIKSQGMTLKIAAQIDETCCRQLMTGKTIEIKEHIPDSLKQLLYEMKKKDMRPKVIVEYVRYPFVEKIGNVRITFDESISSSNSMMQFLDHDIILRPVMESGQEILEVKWDEFLPDYLKNALQLDSLSWTSFSKYYLCRKFNIYGGIRI